MFLWLNNNNQPVQFMLCTENLFNVNPISSLIDKAQW